MRAVRNILAVTVLAVATFATRATADEAQNYALFPAPPGTIVQTELLYPAGADRHSDWRAIASRKSVGRAKGREFYQWFLSLYIREGKIYKLKYQSPLNGGPLSKVTLQNLDAEDPFPVQTVKIDASGNLMGGTYNEFVVESHSMKRPDCGVGTVSVFSADDYGDVDQAVLARNRCSLRAEPINSKAGIGLLLFGPHYAPHDATCCPTEPKAQAMLCFRNGRWLEEPNNYELVFGL